MITVGDKKWDKLDDDEKIAYCEGLFKDSKDAMKIRHFEWYMNYMFIDGQHYATYNATQNKIEQKPRKKGEVRMVVNLIRSSIRAIQNYATRFEPKWEVQPGDEDADTVTTSRRYGKYLDHLYRVLHWEIAVESIVDSLLNTSVAWVEVDWDKKAAGGLGEVMLMDHDSFDIYVDKRAYIYAGKVCGSFICKAVKKSLAEIASDKRYDEKNRKEVKSDKDTEQEDFKQRLETKQQGSNNENAKKEATVKEFFLYDYEKNSAGGNITLFTYAGGQKLREKALEDTEFPLYCAQIQQDTKKIYHRTWTADAVPLNKALDRIVSQKIMYVNKALTYEIIAEKGHGVDTVTNEHGIVTEINRNVKWEQRQLQPLPSTIDKLTDEMEGYIDRILGTNDATRGEMPPGSRSGDQIEALQAADANTLASVRKAVQIVMSLVGKKALEIASKKYVASRFIEITEEEGEKSQKTQMKVVGDGAPEKVKEDKDMVVLKDNNEVIVSIGSWLGYTKEAQRETLERWVELGMMAAEDALQYMEFPNAEYLSKRARADRLEKEAMQMEIAGHGEGAAGAVQEGQTEDAMVQLADDENQRMMSGEVIPPTPHATPEHMQAHQDFVVSNFFKSQATDKTIAIFNQHMTGEQDPNIA